MPKPKVSIAPLEQGKMLYENVSQYNSNLLSIISNLGGQVKDIVTSPAPCELSKFMTDQICRINQGTINLLTGESKLGLFDFSKIKELTQSSLNITKNLINSPDNKLMSENIVKLRENINGIEKINKLNNDKFNIINKSLGQKGGSNEYAYIINPLTNRKVRTNSKTGKAILAQYISNMR